MKGIFRNCSRQDPGEARGWPEPSAPTPVSYREMKGWSQRCLGLVLSLRTKDIYFSIWKLAHHHKRISNPERKPAHWAVWNHTGLAVNGDHVGSGVTHRTPTTPEKLLFFPLLISSFVKDALFQRAAEISPDACLKATESLSLTPSKQTLTGRIFYQDQSHILLMDRWVKLWGRTERRGTDTCRHLHTSASGRWNDFQKAKSSRMFIWDESLP